MTQNRMIHAGTRRYPEETEEQVRNKRGKVVSRQTRLKKFCLNKEEEEGKQMDDKEVKQNLGCCSD